MRVLTLIAIIGLLVFGFSSCKNGSTNSGNIGVQADSVETGKPFIIELIGSNIDTVSLMGACVNNGIKSPDIYRWKDHYVVYGSSSNKEEISSAIRSAFPDAQVKLYADPFYEFNRDRCQDKDVAKEWDHIILTANLVEDTIMQKEYMTYHATQFKEWPEVSNGFCNANFQQLLLFRNGRQLMLVISIPEGASLDELNPKTTENNPRVDDWNVLMKKYQVGIEGTKPGEVWVFLEEIGSR